MLTMNGLLLQIFGSVSLSEKEFYVIIDLVIERVNGRPRRGLVLRPQEGDNLFLQFVVVSVPKVLIYNLKALLGVLLAHLKQVVLRPKFYPCNAQL